MFFKVFLSFFLSFFLFFFFVFFYFDVNKGSVFTMSDFLFILIFFSPSLFLLGFCCFFEFYYNVLNFYFFVSMLYCVNCIFMDKRLYRFFLIGYMYMYVCVFYSFFVFCFSSLFYLLFFYLIQNSLNVIRRWVICDFLFFLHGILWGFFGYLYIFIPFFLFYYSFILLFFYFIVFFFIFLGFLYNKGPYKNFQFDLINLEIVIFIGFVLFMLCFLFIGICYLVSFFGDSFFNFDQFSAFLLDFYSCLNSSFYQFSGFFNVDACPISKYKHLYDSFKL